jgi:hypothetical protein
MSHVQGAQIAIGHELSMAVSFCLPKRGQKGKGENKPSQYSCLVEILRTQTGMWPRLWKIKGTYALDVNQCYKFSN